MTQEVLVNLNDIPQLFSSLEPGSTRDIDIFSEGINTLKKLIRLRTGSQ